jgi:glutamate--cysteine ligase catalytic subunit
MSRRALAKRNLKENELPVTVTSFPRLGVPGIFTDPYYDPANAQASHSLFLPDEITNPHVRFPYVTYYSPARLLIVSTII